MGESEQTRRGTEPSRGEEEERRGEPTPPAAPRVEGDDTAAGVDAAGFARANATSGSEVGLGGGEGNFGGGGDLAGDFGGLDEEGDEGAPA